jgi:AraC-like DNA-binding protein
MKKNKKGVLNIELLKNFFHIGLNRWIVFSSLFILSSVYIYYSAYHPKMIFPAESGTTIDFFNDSGNGGTSELLKQSISDSTIELKFRLKDGFQSPYVGISFHNETDSVFNEAHYNRLYLEISGEQLRTIGFSLFAGNEFSKNKNEVCFYENIDIDAERKQYVIDLDKLKVPEWWYASNNVPVDEKFEPDLQYIYSINIGTAFAAASDVSRSIKIYSLYFERDNKSLILLLISLELIIILLVAAGHYIKAYKTTPVMITYKAVDVEKENQHINSFLDYINNHFHDSNLTLRLVSEQTGINQRRITSYIQKSFGCNFKTYVNRLRINESKRLLVESELNMGETAFKVGFSNQTHFNRVFKNFEGISPSEYRENIRN